MSSTSEHIILSDASGVCSAHSSSHSVAVQILICISNNTKTGYQSAICPRTIFCISNLVGRFQAREEKGFKYNFPSQPTHSGNAEYICTTQICRFVVGRVTAVTVDKKESRKTFKFMCI